MSSTDIELSHDAREFITFEVAGMDYCIEIAAVREIRGWSTTTPLPHAPDYFMGVINLRGSVLPVIDLARRLGQPASTPSARHAVIVLQMDDRTVGLLVDAVADILAIDDEHIEAIPSSASEKARSFVTGIISTDDKMIRVLGLDTIIPDSEQAAA